MQFNQDEMLGRGTRRPNQDALLAQLTGQQANVSGAMAPAGVGNAAQGAMGAMTGIFGGGGGNAGDVIASRMGGMKAPALGAGEAGFGMSGKAPKAEMSTPDPMGPVGGGRAMPGSTFEPDGPVGGGRAMPGSTFAPDPRNTGITGTGSFAPGEPSPSMPDTSQWDTDGYLTPKFTAKGGGQAPPGWEQANWDNPNMQTPKYVIGRITSQYAGKLNDPQALQALGADLEQAYPGGKFDGKDRFRMPDGSEIDIISKAGSAEAAPWFQPLNDAVPDAPQGRSGGAPMGGIPLDGLLAGDPMASIQAALGQYANQRPNLEALLRSLGVER